jgi:hypothetical protein
MILLITLIAVASIGFMWGSFMALIIFIIAAIIGYFTNSSIALVVVLFISLASAIHKFGIIDIIKNVKR